MEQKKLIFIVLGSALLIFIFVFGINTYYKEKENSQPTQLTLLDETIETAKLESNRCLTENFKGLYKICCEITEGDKKGLFYNCTSEEYQGYFEPNQLVHISFDQSRDLLVPYRPYFLRVYSDLNNPILLDEADASISFDITDVLGNENPMPMKLLGTVPQEFNQESYSFVLLRLNVYPDNTFNEENSYTILNLQAKVFKE